MVVFLRLAYFRFVTGNNHCELRSSFPSLDPQVKIQKFPRSHDFQLFTIILRGIGRIIFTSPVVIQESRNWGTAEFSSGWIDPSKSRREAE